MRGVWGVQVAQVQQQGIEALADGAAAARVSLQGSRDAARSLPDRGQAGTATTTTPTFTIPTARFPRAAVQRGGRLAGHAAGGSPRQEGSECLGARTREEGCIAPGIPAGMPPALGARTTFTALALAALLATAAGLTEKVESDAAAEIPSTLKAPSRRQSPQQLHTPQST
eukprot:CAMPEP_0173211796 /NCGR_PEP_ID=MMETSP1141-20130122/24436_1 /TAXON_ID=483371 /ORGANISM="non described non described, Strain CCMP2298" /LENGTH=169 /DNA_ID=CAMNT_0014138729 /DNA_START=551 /DNA_END=1057 /DNA_ORIENTATION=+